MKKIVFDSRIRKGIIWNVAELLSNFPFGNSNSPWNHGITTSDEKWIDQFVYEGFCAHGSEFLKGLNGRFAIVYHDIVKNNLFLTRDWIGEMPFHYLATETGLYFANSILSIKQQSDLDFRFENVRAFPQSQFQIIELNDVDEQNIAATYRPDKRQLYYDFEANVQNRALGDQEISTYEFAHLRSRVINSILERAKKGDNTQNYLLLSGGLDSLSLAVAMKAAGLSFEAYSLSVDNKPGEADVAKEFAKKIGIKHTIFNVTTDEILSSYHEAVTVGEAYHLYNVYCTVCMLLLGKKLAMQGISNAFCGEAMNEAVGDYKDWKIYNPILGKDILIQKINTERLQNVKERTLYVWGHSTDKGKYNRQLGSGLAKHASARMVKPFLNCKIDLECPYYDQGFLSSTVALTSSQLKSLGGKPGLLWRIFKEDFLQYGFTEEEIHQCKKIRFQDASENGESGISSVLLTTGNDQEKTLSIYNSIFSSNYNVKEKSQTLLCTN